jgi:hypothetical protein
MRTLTREEALQTMYMNTHKGYIGSLSFEEIVRTIGEPTFVWNNSDINFEWAVEYRGSIFVIYNWRSTPNECMSAPKFSFNVGGINDATDFIEAVERKAKYNRLSDQILSLKQQIKDGLTDEQEERHRRALADLRRRRSEINFL